jgi:hypothetical protein
VASNHTVGDTAFTNNGAAKDDWIDIGSGQTYSINSLLGNDPGSARLVGFLQSDGLTPRGDITIDQAHQTFTFSNPLSGPTDVTYYEQIGNTGTLAKATAHFAYALTDQTTFQLDGVPADGWKTFDANNGVPGWTNLNGQPLEVVGSSYQGVGSSDGTPWLDTQCSPGGIDIVHSLNAAAGSPGKLSITISAEQFTRDGQAYQTDPNEHVLVYFNGKQVMDITQASLGDFNHFHTLSVDVASASTDTIEIKSVGADGYAGMALDTVTFTGWHF